MAAKSKDGFDDIELQRRSGIPPQGRLGAARNELLALALGLAVLVAIAVSFWLSAG
jgi:hypothetical protein